MKQTNPMLLIDFYKAVHAEMLPKGITKSVSTYPINYYRSFESKIGWSLKYKIVRNDGSEKIPLTDVPSTMYYNADGTGTS